MKIATLALVMRDNNGMEELLIARKKDGEIGVGMYSPPGGKLEAFESLEDATVREGVEEMGIVLDAHLLEEVAVLDVHRATLPGYDEGELPLEDSEEALDYTYSHFMRVFVYRTVSFLGVPHETDDMEEPIWWPTDSLPYSAMYGGDEHWMKHVLASMPNKRRFVVYRYNGRFQMMETHELGSFEELMET